MRSRAIRAAGVAAALAVALTGCVTAFLPGKASEESTPTGETVSAALQPYYSQVLTWTRCEGEFQCAEATAPLDWSDPARESISLALIRSTAPGDAQGSLLVNPGGPGGSGYDFIRDSLDYAVSDRLRGAFDIVGFDPRGVNRSSAVSCYDDPAEFDSFLFDITPGEIGSAPWIAAIEESSAEFGRSCLEHTGELLGFVDTVSAARDLDLLRAVLGDDTLHYLGYSYGTLLGATYADLYPDKTGRLVLDGAVDPATTDFEVTATQAQGFESALRAYLTQCLPQEECPFGGSVDGAMTSVRGLLDELDANPIRATDGRLLGSEAMFTAIILPLYSESNWPLLNTLFADVMAGEADYAFRVADSYYSRNPDGSYSDNSTEAFVAVNCLDYTATSTTETLQQEADELRRLAPVFGPSMSWGGTSCADWPFPATRDRGAITASGSGPILVLGTTNDPATPYVWAQSLAAQLENGYLVTYQGEGHTAYNKTNRCVNDAVDDYVIDGVVPETDPLC